MALVVATFPSINWWSSNDSSKWESIPSIPLVRLGHCSLPVGDISSCNGTSPSSTSESSTKSHGFLCIVYRDPRDPGRFLQNFVVRPLKTSKARKPMNIPHFSCWNHHIGMVKHVVNTWDTWRIIPWTILVGGLSWMIPFLNSDFLKYGYPKSSI